MESIPQESQATQRFRVELRNFLQFQLGITGPAIDKVADLTIMEAKKTIERSNLDDLNDIAK